LNPTKDFIKTVELIGRRHSRHQVFDDFVRLASCSLLARSSPWHADQAEADYMQTVKRYDREEAHQMAQLFALTTMALEERMHDFLGSVFMQLEISNSNLGQFFTPYELCVLMAEMQLGDVREDDPRELITFQEPACGAGATMIAAMDVLKKRGINYQRRTYTVAVDVSETAARMAYIQFSLLGIPAHVVWGNSLSLEVRQQWPTLGYGLIAHKVAAWRRGPLPPVPEIAPENETRASNRTAAACR
jgi:hypothetical protein